MGDSSEGCRPELAHSLHAPVLLSILQLMGFQGSSGFQAASSVSRDGRLTVIPEEWVSGGSLQPYLETSALGGTFHLSNRKRKWHFRGRRCTARPSPRPSLL